MILNPTKKSLLLILLLISSCSSEPDIDYRTEQCNILEGCLNYYLAEHLLHDHNAAPYTTSLKYLATKEYDQVVNLRKFQFNLSKSCGALELTLYESGLFSNECDYLIFSRNGKMTEYIKGHCFSGFDKLDDSSTQTIHDKNGNLLINSVFKVNQEIIIDKRSIFIQVERNPDTKPIKLDCFSSFEYQAP